MARILVSWGLISSAMMFATGPWSFAWLRVLLGFAEAGFFPGIIYYTGDWFPTRIRTQAVALLKLTGSVIASMVGNPVSGFIIEYMNEVGGLWGWQWVFLLEGLPPWCWISSRSPYLTDRPDQARWLTPAERIWLAQQIDNDRDTFHPFPPADALELFNPKGLHPPGNAENAQPHHPRLKEGAPPR